MYNITVISFLCMLNCLSDLSSYEKRLDSVQQRLRNCPVYGVTKETRADIMLQIADMQKRVGTDVLLSE